jgi:hypothetical protein
MWIWNQFRTGDRIFDYAACLVATVIWNFLRTGERVFD